jgi:hypothetical protein
MCVLHACIHLYSECQLNAPGMGCALSAGQMHAFRKSIYSEALAATTNSNSSILQQPPITLTLLNLSQHTHINMMLSLSTRAFGRCAPCAAPRSVVAKASTQTGGEECTLHSRSLHPPVPVLRAVCVYAAAAVSAVLPIRSLSSPQPTQTCVPVHITEMQLRLDSCANSVRLSRSLGTAACRRSSPDLSRTGGPPPPAAFRSLTH